VFDLRVLVTGGAGYIGSVAATLLMKQGYQVTVLDDISSGHVENIPVGARFVRGSLLDREEVLDALDECESVLHFAGKALVEESVKNPELYQLVNVDGTNNLLTQMRDQNIKKLVFSSSAATYGEVNTIPITESSETNPLNPYGYSKLQAEKLISKESAEYELSAISLRYFNVAGALKTDSGWLSETHDPETHLIPNILKSSAENPVKIFGYDWPTPDGTCIRDYIHVADLVEAHLLALLSLKNPEYKTYNLGSGTGYSIREVIEAAEKATGKKIPFVDVERRSGDPAILVADITKVKKELGWEPVRNLEQMVEDAFNSNRNDTKKI
jgi:UDP-glucose 4-epimerase